MFGNLVGRRQLKALLDGKDLIISPFEDRFLRASHYTLHPGRVFRRDDSGQWSDSYNFKTRNPKAPPPPMALAANEYVLVEILEDIKILKPGIVGRFIVVSTNIEAGLLVVAGQVDNKYGSGGERIRFGLKNLLSVENQLAMNTRLAHLEFFDLRGIETEDTPLTQEDREVRSKRQVRAEDDGPWSAHDDNDD